MNPPGGFQQALQSCGYANVVSEANNAYRVDVSYAEVILNAATKLQLKREAWATRMGRSEPKIPKPVTSSTPIFSVDDLDSLIA